MTRRHIDIGLPLPIDLASTIGNLIDAAYPGTVLDTTAGHGVMRLLLPEGQSARRVSKRTVAAAIVEESEHPIQVTGWEPTDSGMQASFSAPEQLVRAVLPLVKAVMDTTEGAVNYVEQEVVDREPPYGRYVVIVARSQEQTPHALRVAAEDRLAAVLAVCDAAEHQATRWEAPLPVPEWVSRVREAAAPHG